MAKTVENLKTLKQLGFGTFKLLAFYFAGEGEQNLNDVKHQLK